MDGSTALDSILNLASTFKGDDSGHLTPEEKEKLWSLQDELEGGGLTENSNPEGHNQYTVSVKKVTITHENALMMPHPEPGEHVPSGPAKDAKREVLQATIAHPETGKTIGTAQFRVLPDGKRLFPESVNVHPDHRRQGVATALYEHMESLGHEVVKQPGTTREGAKFRRAFDKRKSTTSNSSSEDGSTVWNQLRSVCNVADWPNLFSPESLVENRGYAGETKLTLIANEADQFLGCFKRELSRESIKLLRGLMKLG